MLYLSPASASAPSFLPAVIKAGTSFKYTVNSPLFSSKGEMSFEVTLPLHGCPENIAIFRPVHFRQVDLDYLGNRGLFRLSLPGGHTTEGDYLITTANEREVKIKLSSAAPRFLDEGGEDRYIDELPLGAIYEEDWDELRAAAGAAIKQDAPCTPGNVAFALNQISLLDGMDNTQGCDRAASFAYGRPSKSVSESRTYKFRSCYAFPVQQVDGTLVNEFFSSIYPQPYYKTDLKDRGYIFRPFFGGSQLRNAYQPRLLVVLSRVLRAIGYTFDETGLTDFDRGHIIVSNILSYNLAEILPHWKVSEFFAEIQNFFMASIFLDPVRHTARLVRLNEVIDRPPVPVSAADPFNVDTDEDTRGDSVLSGNVAYDFPEIPKQLCLPEDVFKNFPVEWSDEAPDDSKIMPADTVRHSNELYQSWINNGKNGNAVVDHYCPLLRTRDRKCGLKLRIVPARQTLLDHKNHDGNGDIDETGRTYIPVLVSSFKFQEYHTARLNDAILGGDNPEPTEKPSKIEVANVMNGEIFIEKPVYDGTNVVKRVYNPVPLAQNLTPDTFRTAPLSILQVNRRIQELYNETIDPAAPNTYDPGLLLRSLKGTSYPNSLFNDYTDSISTCYRLPWYYTHVCRMPFAVEVLTTRETYEATILIPVDFAPDPLVPLLIDGRRCIPLSFAYTLYPDRPTRTVTLKYYKL